MCTPQQEKQKDINERHMSKKKNGKNLFTQKKRNTPYNLMLNLRKKLLSVPKPEFSHELILLRCVRRPVMDAAQRRAAPDCVTVSSFQ